MNLQQYLKVVICFSILTDLTKFLLSFCGWSVRRTRSYRCEKNKERQELKLGDAQGTPSKYSKDTQASKLGDAPVGIPPFFFNNYRLVSVDRKFLLLHMMIAILRMSFNFSLLAVLIKYQDLKFLIVRESSHSCIIIKLLIDLHLYLSE